MSIWKYISLESIVRHLHSISELIWEIPKSKHIFQRFKIYELIISNNKSLAVDFFNYYLNNKTVEFKFSHIISHFSTIFNNFSITRNILLQKYISMKEKLISKAFNLYIELLEKNELIILKKKLIYTPDHLLCIYDRTIYDYEDMPLLECEKEMIVLVNKEVKSIEFNKKYHGILEKEISNLPIKNCDFCFDEIFNICNLGNSENNVISNDSNGNVNTFYDNSNLFDGDLDMSNGFAKNNESNWKVKYLDNSNISYSTTNNNFKYPNTNDLNYSNHQDTETLNVRRFIIYCEDDIILSDISNVLGKNTRIYKCNIDSIMNKNSLIYYIGIPEHHFPKKNVFSFHIFIGVNSNNLFLKTYNINIRTSIMLNSSFNKNVNKIKKFKLNNKFLKDFNPKFVKKEVLDKVIIRRFGKYLKSIDLGNFGPGKRNEPKDHIDTSNDIDFTLNFINGNLFPPFKHNQVHYNSFSTKYLIFLFSHAELRDLYNKFIDDLGDIFINLIIDKYDVKNKQQRILESLRYYISNLDSIYNFNFIDNDNKPIHYTTYIKNNSKINDIQNIVKFKDFYEYLDSILDKDMNLKNENTRKNSKELSIEYNYNKTHSVITSNYSMNDYNIRNNIIYKTNANDNKSDFEEAFKDVFFDK